MNARSDSRRRLSGFTLFELLIVLALLGLMSGLVAPRASQWLEAAEVRGWRADLRARLEMLPSEAFRTGESARVDMVALLASMPPKPKVLEITLAAPLQYAASGLAAGGVLEVAQGVHRERWHVEPITGDVRIENLGGR